MNQQTSLADEGNVVLVYPQGYNCMWNLGPEADLSDIERPTASTDEEVLFISDIIDMLSSVEGINDTNIYASGTSNGAAFSHYITAQTEHPFKGIATMVSGLDVDGEPLASQPTISVLQMMNKRDSIIPFDGGESITGHTYLSAEDSILAWATHNGCDVVPQESGNEDAMFYHYPNCTDGVQVTSVAVLPSPWPNECEQAWVSAQENNTPWIPPEGVTCGSGHDISSERLDEDVWLYAWRFLQREE